MAQAVKELVSLSFFVQTANRITTRAQKRALEDKTRTQLLMDRGFLYFM